MFYTRVPKELSEVEIVADRPQAETVDVVSDTDETHLDPVATQSVLVATVVEAIHAANAKHLLPHLSGDNNDVKVGSYR